MIYNLNNGKIDYAVMAIENSTAGSIIPNYALIDEYDIHIVGEYYLQITHNLMALKGQSLKDIKEVQSHPMALLQCRDFFKNNSDITLVEEKDTAQIAKKIADMLNTSYYHTSFSDDINGVEVSAAIKNIFSMACLLYTSPSPRD